MLVPRLAVCLVSAVLMMCGLRLVAAQDYPAKPIRIVTSGVGGSADFTSRLVAQGLSSGFGWQVVVDNRASGVIPGETVARSPADGYTVLVAGATFWVAPLIQPVSFDPVKDFMPVSMTDASPNVLVIHTSVPAKSVRELVALAKSRPGALNYVSTGTGGISHLAGELFKHMAGVKIERIPYKSSGASMTDLVGGFVQMAVSPVPVVVPHVSSGRLRALAVTSIGPSALFPGLPPVAAALPGYEAVSFDGMFAPAGTPAAIVNVLNQRVVQTLNRTDIKEKFFSAGVEIVGSAPGEFAAKVKSEMAKWGVVVKSAGIKAD
jgi:tripartite-type tricarboxylate transporter receptor subunit TctC